MEKPISRQLAAGGKRRGLSGPALRTFLNIAAAWALKADDTMTLLGSPAPSTFYKWKKAPDSASLGADTLERISLRLGIYKALQILLPEKGAADRWIHAPNDATPFGGHSALSRMLGGQVSDLYVVREYLDAQRGWG